MPSMLDQALAPELLRVARAMPSAVDCGQHDAGRGRTDPRSIRELREAQHPDLTLLIAPRHPERFDAVERLIRSKGFRARGESVGPGKDVLLLDSIGELASAFRYANVVFMGGTLVPRGGHNILEPAAFAEADRVSVRTWRISERSADLFIEAKAAVEVRDAQELAAAVDGLLSDAPAAAELGERARRVVEENTGATERVLAYLQ